MSAPRGRKRCLTDVIVLAMLEHEAGEWVNADTLSEETGIPLTSKNTGLLRRCRFLVDEYGLLRLVLTTARPSSRLFVVQLRHEKLESYEAGNWSRRPGRTPREEYYWPSER